MTNNPKINISRHAVERFYERVGEQLLKTLSKKGRFRYAIKTIREMWSGAVYVSDSERGILFREINYKVDFVVKDKTILTIIPLKK